MIFQLSTESNSSEHHIESGPGLRPRGETAAVDIILNTQEPLELHSLLTVVAFPVKGAAWRPLIQRPKLRNNKLSYPSLFYRA